MVAITVPLNASGDDGDRARSAPPGSSADPSGGTGNSDAPGTVAPVDPPAKRGVGTDQLTPDEEERARALALGQDRAARSTSEDVRGRTGAPQYLRVELLEDPDGGFGSSTADRRAEVSYYDYGDDTLVRKTVDLSTGEVTSSARTSGAQPPPTRQEAAEAAAVLLRSPAGAGLRQDYRAATDRQLTDADQLTVRGMMYRAPAGATGQAAQCGEHRCMTLFTRVRGGPWIDTRYLVVDLSDRVAFRVR
ncbi:hypothetical protein AQ490_21640 [Wenjunlia vitaminophila]|uniref:Tat pathway signal sequence domain protein n=2 Tax=Wenjunlia vitaminophila TaxID=76728 RepID=A0A0T6LSM9_WENVI|nr:hypothetical protein AQ490_21640 [Wenjunlia vitaminophila]